MAMEIIIMGTMELMMEFHTIRIIKTNRIMRWTTTTQTHSCHQIVPTVFSFRACPNRFKKTKSFQHFHKLARSKSPKVWFITRVIREQKFIFRSSKNFLIFGSKNKRPNRRCNCYLSITRKCQKSNWSIWSNWFQWTWNDFRQTGLTWPKESLCWNVGKYLRRPSTGIYGRKSNLGPGMSVRGALTIK